jgi:hypothetical protein
LRQSITLAGFGTPTFERGIKALLDVQAFFDRHVPENKIDECTIIDKCEKGLTLHLTNHYFTPKQDAGTEEEISFPAEIDPSGILAALSRQQFIHAEQNVVRYYSRSVVQGGVIKYIIYFKDKNAEQKGN